MRKTFSELEAIYRRPFFDLLQESRLIHSEHWPENEVQLCTLLSVKTGGCSEDCAYCAQSSRYNTGLAREKLMSAEEKKASTGKVSFVAMSTNQLVINPPRPDSSIMNWMPA